MLDNNFRSVLSESLVFGDRDVTAVLTISWMLGELKMDKISRDLAEIMRHIDREILGRRYHQKPRTKAWFVAEKLNRAAHVHGAISLNAEEILLVDELLQGGIKSTKQTQKRNRSCNRNGLIKAICGSAATYKFASINDAADPTIWTDYATKSLTDTDNLLLFG